MGRNTILILLLVALVGFVVQKHDRLEDIWAHRDAWIHQLEKGNFSKPQEAASSTQPQTLTSLSAAVNSAFARPAPGAQPESAEEPGVPGPHKAPPGFLYVLRHVSKTTDSGVMAIDPGIRLALIERGPAKTKVTDGHTDFEVDNDYLTDDMDLASLAQRSDPQSQAELVSLVVQKRAEAAREAAAKVESAQAAHVQGSPSPQGELR